MPRKPNITNEDLELVYNTIDDYIFENHEFCSINEIAERSQLSRTKCESILELLVKNKRLYKAFGSKGNPYIFLPTYMMEEILRKQPKPSWVSDYSFDEKKDKLKEIEELREGIKQFEMFERLLYATDTPLEEAVAYAFGFLGFKDVKHLKNPEYHDVEFTYDDILYLVEVKGKSRNGNKDDVQELESWVKKKIVTENMKREDLEGLFVINHYRNLNPKERDDPLTPHAKEFLKLNNFKFITSIFLFDLIKKVCNDDINKEEARNKIIKGQKID